LKIKLWKQKNAEMVSRICPVLHPTGPFEHFLEILQLQRYGALLREHGVDLFILAHVNDDKEESHRMGKWFDNKQDLLRLQVWLRRNQSILASTWPPNVLRPEKLPDEKQFLDECNLSAHAERLSAEGVTLALLITLDDAILAEWFPILGHRLAIRFWKCKRSWIDELST